MCEKFQRDMLPRSKDIYEIIFRVFKNPNLRSILFSFSIKKKACMNL